MPRWVIPKDAARGLVASGTKSVGKSVQTIRRPALGNEESFALVSLSGDWTSSGPDGYRASGVIVNGSGIATSGLITIYAPNATSETADELPKGKVHVANVNGRWELIQGGGDSNGETFEAAPMLLRTPWSRNNDGIWYGTASPIIADSGAVDASEVYTVYVPTATSQPAGEAGTWRFWAVWRNERWESIQQENETVEVDKYVAGLGIEIGAHNAELGGRPITNTGVRAVRISGSSYQAQGGPLNLASNHFQWRTSSLSGESEVYLKTHRISVIVDIQNGEPVKKTIEVIGAD